MTALELSNELRRMLDSGELLPDAIFVRPFCQCDEDVGYIEIQYVDQVRRMFADETNSTAGTRRIFHFGNSESENAIQTVKLG